MKRIWVSLVAAGLLAIAALAPASAQDSVTLDLEEVDGSGVSGNVRIESEDGQATVTILLTEGLEDESVHPVHIHEGTCDDLGDVAYPLNNIEDGSSETTIDVDLADLRTGSFAINAHESEENIDVYIACADIPAAVGGDAEDDDADDGGDTSDGDEGSADEDTTDDGAADEDQDGDAGDDQAAEDSGDDASEDDGAADEGEEEADDSTDDAADDEAADESDDQAGQDDEATDEGEGKDQDAVMPSTGSSGMDSDTAALTLMLIAGGGLATGMLLRRRATQVQRS